MLPRTPAPKTTESLLGYALRISETNGYDTPWHILSYAGFVQGEMRTPGFPVEKLAAVLGRETSALTPIAYCASDSDGRYFKILGHRLGASMKNTWLRLAKPEFCPKCAEEDGYLDAFWDLSQAVACSKHGCRLLSICPNCGQQLRWFRPGLLECRCGASLAAAPMQPADPVLVQLMAILRAKLHGTSILDLPNEPGFPLAELEPMPFKSFLGMLDHIARFAASSRSGENLPPYDAVVSVAHVLADWPLGYHKFLEPLGHALMRHQPGTIGLRKQFAPFYHAMFKGKQYAGDCEFLRTEFVKFGQTSWGEAIIDRKLLRKDMKPDDRFRSQSRTANDLGIRPVTLLGWAKKGLVPAKGVDIGGQRRYIFDKTSPALVATAEGQVLETRKAAAHINIPVRVLLGVKRTGQYAAANMPSQKRGFHEVDLAALRSRMLERAALLRTIPQSEQVISLDRVMRRVRFWSKTGAAEFVAAYLDGTIQAIGRTGESWSEVFFLMTDVDAMARASRTTQSDGAISQQEAASRLDCGSDIVAGLLSQGLLTGVPGPDRKRVTGASIDRFSSDYIGLAAIARQEGTSARRLDRLCTTCGIHTVGISRKGSSVAKFIRIGDQQRLRESHKQ